MRSCAFRFRTARRGRRIRGASRGMATPCGGFLHKPHQSMMDEGIRVSFSQQSKVGARYQRRETVEPPCERVPTVAVMIAGVEDRVPAHPAFPETPWSQSVSTSPLEGVNGEVKRRGEVMGIVPTRWRLPAWSGPWWLSSRINAGSGAATWPDTAFPRSIRMMATVRTSYCTCAERSHLDSAMADSKAHT